MLSRIIATCTIRGLGPYTQSANYDHIPQQEGEHPDARDQRLWREHLYVVNGTVHIKSTAMHKSIAAGAQYSGKKIPGARGKTWSAKFGSGIAIFNDIDLGFKPDDDEVICLPLYMHSGGNSKMGGARVVRRLPSMPVWGGTFDVHILDPIITRQVFEEMFEYAGMFIGIGQNRPENKGQSGRYELTKLVWREDRKPVAVRDAA